MALARANAGEVRNSAGSPYKPSALRNYESSFYNHLCPLLGSTPVGRLKRRDVQALVDQLSLVTAGSTVRNAIVPLQVMCRYAVTRELIETNPCDGLELPARSSGRFAASEDGRGREAVATADEAADLIDALPLVADRAVWATAFYAGLRRGELRGLRRQDIDCERRVIHVERSWDALDGAIDPKSPDSTRVLPINAHLWNVLSAYLDFHDGREFAFPGYGRWGRTYGAFSADALLKRTRKTWINAGLNQIGLHEARHTYASLMIAAGIPIAVVSRRMGHSSISVTERVYFHLLPECHDRERAIMDEYLAGRGSK